MSMAALDWAFACDVKGPAKAVLIVLANHAGDDGACWPSLDRIAAHSGLAKRTVQDALAALASRGVIADEGPSGHRTTRYRVNMAPRATVAPDATVAGDATVAPPATVARAATVAPAATEQWQEPPQNSGASRHQTLNEPSLNLEEKKEARKPRRRAGGDPLPDPPSWLDAEAWGRFVSHRAAIRKPLTPDAAFLTWRKLDDMRRNGLDPACALDASVANGWQGVFEPKVQARSPPKTNRIGEALRDLGLTDQEDLWAAN